MRSNSITRNDPITLWMTPGPEFQSIASAKQYGSSQYSVTLFELGSLDSVTGYGTTPRAAYRAADHQRRYARHTVEGLLRKRRQSVQRELDYRAKLKLAGHCLDMTCINYEDELTALRDAQDELQAELTTVRADKFRAEREVKTAEDRIRTLESAGIEKDRGMALIRQAFADAGITEGNLLERVKALATERDHYRVAAQPNTAATV